MSTGQEVVGDLDLSLSNASVGGFLTLPSEIMGQIFHESCQTKHEQWYHRRPVAKSDYHPLNLGNVCKAWRQVAWSTSELWSIVRIHLFKSDSEEKILERGRLLKEWLGRASGRPLDLSFQYWSDAFEEARTSHRPPTVPIEIIDTLVLHCERWRSLELSIPMPWCDRLIRPNVSLPALHTLHFSTKGRTGSTRIDTLSITNAPKLEELILNSCGFGDINLPKHQIRKLALQMSSQVDIRVAVYQFFPNVVECRFLVHDNYILHNPHAVVILPYLQTLEITQMTSNESRLKLLLDGLQTPYLSYLKLTTLGVSRIKCPVIQSFLISSGCFLSELHFQVKMHGALPEDHHLINLLDCTPSLKKLCLTAAHSSRIFFSYGLGALFFQSLDRIKRPSYLPNLEVFSYEGDLEVDNLAELVVSLLTRSSSDSQVTECDTNRAVPLRKVTRVLQTAVVYVKREF
ncbi:hypothetical protein B0H34DRAFT_700614 [Crassisporium funariophilum]|nr:hypothetical protein B0H34DRAFT_700614 [Crassisporium funariophilum]